VSTSEADAARNIKTAQTTFAAGGRRGVECDEQEPEAERGHERQAEAGGHAAFSPSLLLRFARGEGDAEEG
jgi:hypothetical protein